MLRILKSIYRPGLVGANESMAFRVCPLSFGLCRCWNELLFVIIWDHKKHYADIPVALRARVAGVVPFELRRFWNKIPDSTIQHEDNCK